MESGANHGSTGTDQSRCPQCGHVSAVPRGQADNARVMCGACGTSYSFGDTAMHVIDKQATDVETIDDSAGLGLRECLACGRRYEDVLEACPCCGSRASTRAALTTENSAGRDRNLSYELVLTNTESEGLHVELSTGEANVLGRDEDADIRIDHDQISRHHCRLNYTDGHWIITDLGSTNGTFVNEQRIDDRTEVIQGDRIRVGRAKLMLRARGADDPND